MTNWPLLSVSLCLGLAACDQGSGVDLPRADLIPFTFALAAPSEIDEGQSAALTITDQTGLIYGESARFELVLDAGEAAVTIDSGPTPGQSWQLASQAVDADTRVEGRIIGSYRRQTVEQSFDVTIRNYDRSPLLSPLKPSDQATPSVSGTRLLGLVGPDKPALVPASVYTLTREPVETPDGAAHQDVWTEWRITENGTFDTPIRTLVPGSAGWPDATPALFSQVQPNLQFGLVWSRTAGAFLTLLRPLGPNLELPDAFTAGDPVTAPDICAVSALRRRDEATGRLNFLDLLIGMPTGLALSAQPANEPGEMLAPLFSPPQPVDGQSGNFCHLAPLTQSYVKDTLAYDEDTFALTRLLAGVRRNVAHEALAPLGQRPGPNQTLIGMITGRDRTDQDSIAFLFSDGQHRGAHNVALRLVDDSAQMPPPETGLSLLSGAPIALQFDYASTPDTHSVWIAAPDTPYLTQVDVVGLSDGIVSSSSESFFEVGFGVVDFWKGDGYLVTALEDGQLTLWTEAPSAPPAP